MSNAFENNDDGEANDFSENRSVSMKEHNISDTLDESSDPADNLFDKDFFNNDQFFLK